MMYSCEVKKHIAVLSESKNGKKSLELNKVCYEGRQEELFDLRRWFIDDNGQKQMGKGISLSDYEFEHLRKILIDE